MKKNIYKLWVLLLLPLFAFAHNHPIGKYKKSKVVERSYQTSGIQTLTISSLYGNIHITHRNDGRVTIKATVTVDGNDEEAVEKRLKTIEVNTGITGHRIFAETIIPEEEWSFSGWLFGKSEKVNFKINYEIQMPVSLDLDIDHEYGNFFLDELTGKLSLNLDYGSFDIGKLEGENNRIDTDYVNDSHIGFINSGKINTDYGDIHIDSAYRLEMDCDYTDIEIDDIRHLDYDCDYGSFKVNNSKYISGKGSYQTRYFERVNYLKIDAGYGSLTIKDPLPDFELIEVDGDYLNINFDNTAGVPYRIFIRADYLSLKHKGLSVIEKQKDMSDIELEAYYRNPGAGSEVKFRLDYGSLDIINP